MSAAEIEAPHSAGLYLLCFDRPLGHARHYLGYASNIARRVAEHQAGRAGVALTDAAYKAGISMRLVRVWLGLTEDDEARMKGRAHRKASPAMIKNHKRGRAIVAKYCPTCGPVVRARQAARQREKREAKKVKLYMGDCVSCGSSRLTVTGAPLSRPNDPLERRACQDCGHVWHVNIREKGERIDRA